MTDDERKALKPGDKVRVRNDHGIVFVDDVESEPWELYGHTWVVVLAHAGMYALERVESVVERLPKPIGLLNREGVEKLCRDAGHAINANNGKCELIERVLCNVTTLCVELLNDFDARGL